MVVLILTNEQRDIVTKNHGLIYKFLSDNNLDVNEYYDLCAIGLCNAVKHYDGKKGRLSTLAYKCMNNEVTNVRRKRARNEIESTMISYDIELSNGEDVTLLDTLPGDNKNSEKNYLFKLQISEAIRKMNRDEKKITMRIIQGYTIREISEEMDISHQRVHQILKQNIKNKISKYI